MQTATQKWNADDYAKNSSAQLQWAHELIAKLALGGDETVLDIGCGDGKISAQLASAVSRGAVTGIDASAAMVSHASAQFPPAAHGNLSFRRMDAAAIELPRRFDIAFSNATLHWVADHPAVLRGVRACLKEGGRVLFQMGGRGNAAGIFDAIAKVTADARWAGYFRDFSPPYYFFGVQEYRQWLPENGFDPLRVELITKQMRHSDVAALTGWLRTTWFPYTDRLPGALRDDFLTEVVARYLERHPRDASGETVVDMVRLEVEARVQAWVQ